MAKDNCKLISLELIVGNEQNDHLLEIQRSLTTFKLVDGNAQKIYLTKTNDAVLQPPSVFPKE